MNGFVLAGGRSTRMGSDKALLRYAGRPLIEHAVESLKAVGLEPYIVGVRPDLATYAPVIEDLHPGCGPLGGIEAALAASDSEWNLFLPVDLPLLPQVFLRYLIERSGITGASATIPTLAGKTDPLCAVYRSDLLAGIQKSLEAGDYKVMRCVENAAGPAKVDRFSVEAVAATRDEWPMNLPLRHWFHNLNTPADLRHFQENRVLDA
jgi:molybdopterin-guanine dinucleotide biosynthesis protein A